MFNTYNLREFMAAVPGAEEAIIRQSLYVENYGVSTKYKHKVGGFTVPEGMLVKIDNYKDNGYFDSKKQITMGHKQYVIHENGQVWDAVSLNKHQFTTGDVLQNFKEYCDEQKLIMQIDSQEWKLRKHCSGTAIAYIMTVDSLHKEPSITSIYNYPEVITGGLVLYPNGRTRSLQRVLKHIARYSLYKIKDSDKRVLDAEDSAYARERFFAPAKTHVEDGVISILREDGIVEEIGSKIIKELA